MSAARGCRCCCRRREWRHCTRPQTCPWTLSLNTSLALDSRSEDSSGRDSGPEPDSPGQK
eukprot:15101360-Alexandrium_andersonii.AAC.1